MRNFLQSLLLMAFVCLSLFVSSCSSEKNTEYEPSETFRPAYDSLKTHLSKKTAESSYDIEETVRILNGMELAQGQSADFAEFMEYMARQDYSKVPQEVIEAKMELFPILDKMFQLQKQYDELETWTGIVQHLGNPMLQQAQMAYEMDEEKKGQLSDKLSLFTAFQAAASIDPGIGTVMALGSFADYAFDQYEQHQKLKETVLIQLQQVRLEYATYLGKFAPIYTKYIEEWDRLCLKKDRAYINLYSGQPAEALNNVEEILKEYPDNREAMLLKPFALLAMSRKYDAHKTFTFSPHEIAIDTVNQEYLLRARVAIDEYKDMYPGCSAPALVLEAVWNLYQGNQPQAFTCLEQAAIEYPRQAEKLSDMLDSYRMRAYLTGSAEGTKLMHFYQSTMEGIGLFSPNLIKAMYYEQNGQIEASKEEIYKHFFRRSNQGVYDCLTADMDFCEENLYSSFKQLLPEASYVDVRFKRSSNWIGIKSKDSEPKLDITCVNRSDKDLTNLRLFLVLHFTDMYTTENYVVKLPTINRITAFDEVTLTDVPLRYYKKKFSDITSARVIAMTDNSICWVDNVINDEDKVDYNEAHQIDWMKLSAKIDPEKCKSMDVYLNSIQQSTEDIRSSIMQTSTLSFTEKKNWMKQTEGYVLKVDLPRILSFFTPTFVLNQTIAPSQEIVKGSFIHLEFDVPMLNAGQNQVLYMVSEFMNLAITIKTEGATASVEKIEVL